MSAASPPEVSVVIPTRSRWPLLSTCALPAARAQEDVDLEIVVVDDGSTDDTVERVAALDEPRLRLIRADRPGNVSAARNAGAAAARGTWLAFLDDDDLWAPLKLRLQLDAAAAAGADLVYAGAVVLDEERRAVVALRGPDPADLTAALRARYAVPAGCSNVVVRAESFASAGGFDERLRFFADWDLWLRLAAAGSAAASDELLVGYVRHPESGLFGSPAELDAEVAYLFEKNEANGLRADPARLLAWTAREHRRLGRRGRAAGLYLRAARRSHRAAHAARAAGALLGVGRRPGPPRQEGLDEPEWVEAYR